MSTWLLILTIITTIFYISNCIFWQYILRLETKVSDMARRIKKLED
jgi:hypothetical protein